MLVRVLIVAALVTGPVGLATAVLLRPTTADAVTTAGESPALQARRSAAQEVAVRAVVAWLTTPASAASTLNPWWPAGQLQLPTVASHVLDPAVMSTTATAPGVWLVTVAATVISPGGAPVRRYYQLPMGVAGDENGASAQPLTVPAEVAGPDVGTDVSTSYSIPVPTSSSAGTTVQGFLTALLTGTGDLTRWLSPGSSVQPVQATPYAQAQLVDLQAADSTPGLTDTSTPADGTVAHLLASATVSTKTAADATARSTQYLLELRARAGRWEVTAIDPAPQLGTSDPTSSPTP